MKSIQGNLSFWRGGGGEGVERYYYSPGSTFFSHVHPPLKMEFFHYFPSSKKVQPGIFNFHGCENNLETLQPWEENDVHVYTNNCGPRDQNQQAFLFAYKSSIQKSILQYIRFIENMSINVK